MTNEIPSKAKEKLINLAISMDDEDLDAINDEVENELRKAGHDPDQVVAEVRDVVDRVLEKASSGQSPEADSDSSEIERSGQVSTELLDLLERRNPSSIEDSSLQLRLAADDGSEEAGAAQVFGQVSQLGEAIRIDDIEIVLFDCYAKCVVAVPDTYEPSALVVEGQEHELVEIEGFKQFCADVVEPRLARHRFYEAKQLSMNSALKLTLLAGRESGLYVRLLI